MNKDIFEVYVEKILAPGLRPGDIVVMDNLSAHKSQKVERVINSHAELRFLPPYIPDLNPIGKMWSKVKQILRGLMVRAEESLFVAIGTTLSLVTAADACCWYDSKVRIFIVSAVKFYTFSAHGVVGGETVSFVIAKQYCAYYQMKTDTLSKWKKQGEKL